MVVAVGTADIKKKKKKMLVLLTWMGGGRHRWRNSVNAVGIVD